MPALQSREAPITRLQPLWRALGTQDTRHGMRYWFDINGSSRPWRAHELGTYDFLLAIYPDLEHWRRQFPYGVRRVDRGRALTYFLRACEAVGEYVPAASGDTLTAEPASSTKTSP